MDQSLLEAIEQAMQGHRPAALEQDGAVSSEELKAATIGNRRAPERHAAEVLDYEQFSFRPIEPRDSNDFVFAGLDCRTMQRLYFWVQNSTDRQIIVQLYNSPQADPAEDSRFQFGDPVTIEPAKNCGISIDLDAAWAPFIGVEFNPGTPPSKGNVVVTAMCQKWFPPERST